MDGRAAVGGGHGPKFVVLGEEGREVEGMVDLLDWTAEGRRKN